MSLRNDTSKIDSVFTLNQLKSKYKLYVTDKIPLQVFYSPLERQNAIEHQISLLTQEQRKELFDLYTSVLDKSIFFQIRLDELKNNSLRYGNQNFSFNVREDFDEVQELTNCVNVYDTFLKHNSIIFESCIQAGCTTGKSILTSSQSLTDFYADKLDDCSEFSDDLGFHTDSPSSDIFNVLSLDIKENSTNLDNTFLGCSYPLLLKFICYFEKNFGSCLFDVFSTNNDASTYKKTIEGLIKLKNWNSIFLDNTESSYMLLLNKLATNKEVQHAFLADKVKSTHLKLLQPLVESKAIGFDAAKKEYAALVKDLDDQGRLISSENSSYRLSTNRSLAFLSKDEIDGLLRQDSNKSHYGISSETINSNRNNLYLRPSEDPYRLMVNRSLASLSKEEIDDLFRQESTESRYGLRPKTINSNFDKLYFDEKPREFGTSFYSSISELPVNNSNNNTVESNVSYTYNTNSKFDLSYVETLELDIEVKKQSYIITTLRGKEILIDRAKHNLEYLENPEKFEIIEIGSNKHDKLFVTANLEIGSKNNDKIGDTANRKSGGRIYDKIFDTSSKAEFHDLANKSHKDYFSARDALKPDVLKKPISNILTNQNEEGPQACF